VKRRSLIRLLLACGIVTGTIVSCKQGKGDRCQIDDDCGGGLVCNKATDTCQERSGGGDIDAAVPDAPPDAKPDAP
jgi:hypothetical protein